MRKRSTVCLYLFLFLCIAVVPTKSAGLINGRTSCPATGATTVTTYATSNPVSWAVIQTPTGNAGTVYIGGSSTVSSTTGVGLAAFGSITLQTKGNNSASYDLGRNVWFTCSNTADAIVYVAAQ